MSPIPATRGKKDGNAKRKRNIVAESPAMIIPTLIGDEDGMGYGNGTETLVFISVHMRISIWSTRV